MTTKDEALKMAGYDLDGVIADVEKFDGFDDVCLQTIKRVRSVIAKVLEQPAQEPLGWIPATYKYNLMSNDDEYPIGMVYHSKRDEDDVAVYAHPHQWQGLDAVEVSNIFISKKVNGDATQFAHAIEQALKEKNHG